jgi:hypothetical protein
MLQWGAALNPYTLALEGDPGPAPQLLPLAPAAAPPSRTLDEFSRTTPLDARNVSAW